MPCHAGRRTRGGRTRGARSMCVRARAGVLGGWLPAHACMHAHARTHGPIHAGAHAQVCEGKSVSDLAPGVARTHLVAERRDACRHVRHERLHARVEERTPVLRAACTRAIHPWVACVGACVVTGGQRTARPSCGCHTSRGRKAPPHKQTVNCFVPLHPCGIPIGNLEAAPPFPSQAGLT